MVSATIALNAAAAADRVRLTECTDERGKHSYFMVSTETLEKCPTWDVQHEPPLSITQAIPKAREWLKQKFTSFKFGDISLHFDRQDLGCEAQGPMVLHDQHRRPGNGGWRRDVPEVSSPLC